MQIKEALKVLKAAGAIRKGKKDFVEMILHSVFAEGESTAHKTLDEKYAEVWPSTPFDHLVKQK